MRVYLADLGHNQVTVSSDTYPLGVANLATYAAAQLPDAGLDVHLFREPEDLKAALDAEEPDILGVSSYSWNHNLSLAFARYARGRHPRVLTLMGGPNFPLPRDEQEEWMRGMPEIDIAVRGPTYEGERAFVGLLRRWVEAGGRREGVFEEPLAGSGWIHPDTGAFVMGPSVPRIEDLDEIPSPYLAGLMDPYFATGYFPLMQIARGCPFTCQFCNSSVKSNSKVHAHSLERVKADLRYIAERVRPEQPLCFADDNFGMYERDLEVADYIAWLQDRYDWPRYVRTTTGKNRSERIIEVMRKTRGAMPMTAAVQSMNPEVLVNIKRQNIKLDTYAEIQAEVRRQGMQSYGEMILCLPGETRASFLQGISDLLDSGVLRVSAHQLMLLHGAPLATREQREQFGFQTRFRVVARDIGEYGIGDPVIETEEMVVETGTFSFEDYLEVRVFHLLLTIFHYEGNIEEAFAFAREHGIKPFDLVMRLQQMLPEAPAAFREVIDAFVQESQEELFPTRAACRAWAMEHLDGLRSGELGGNLLSKYSMLGRFYATHAGLDFVQAAIAAALGEDAATDVQEQLAAVMDYLRTVLLHVPFADTLAARPAFRSRWDVDAWSHDDFARPLSGYATMDETEYPTAVDARKRSVIETRVATFGEHAAGLGKFTRTMFARDLRRDILRVEAAVGA